MYSREGGRCAWVSGTSPSWILLCYSATISTTLTQCRNHKRGCQVKERTDYSYCIWRKIFLLETRKSSGEGISYKCSNLRKKVLLTFTSMWKSVFAWHKSWRKPGFISSTACKTGCSYSFFPSRIADYFFSIPVLFFFKFMPWMTFILCHPILYSSSYGCFRGAILLLLS